jgi:predicted metal-binding membrane protein
MERQPPAVHSATAFGRLDRRTALAGALLALAAAAWIATDLRMAGMDDGPGTNPGALGFFIGTWVVMMAAMMLPTTTPMVLTYRALQQERLGHGRSASSGETGLFVAGYLVVWTAAGLLGYALLEAGRSLDGGLFAWDRAGRFIAAGVLVAAALYQLTRSKSACLSRCRSRRAFLLESWRDGRGGALRLGMEHGAWCLGCCWALMAALFALGAMSVGWMALISVLIAAERLLPWRALVTTGVASLLVVGAIGVAAAPARVPMLTIPHSGAGMQAMGALPTHHMPTTCRVPRLTGLVLSVARERSAKAGCRIRLAGAHVQVPSVQTIRGQSPHDGRHGRVVTVWVNPICNGSAAAGPGMSEPSRSTGPTELVSGLYIVGGPLRLWSEPRCKPRPGEPGAGTVTVRDSANGSIVASQTVTRGHLATIPLTPGTYTIQGTFANATFNGQPGESIPTTVEIQAGKTVRQDVFLSVP